jgi:hypothetical protein
MDNEYFRLPRPVPGIRTVSAEPPLLVKSNPSSPKRLLLWLTLVLLLTALAEGSSALFLRMLSNSSAHFLIWNPDIGALSKIWADAAGNWDDQIGWPSPREATAPPRVRTGAKLNANFPELGNACVSAYGDSFVWGDDIPINDGWIEQLSRKLGCLAANYGVSGYGTDQALIRFRRTTGDEAPVTMLGIFPENVTRNVNHYRMLIGYRPHPRWLKGRFVLEDGALRWIDRPAIDEQGFIELHRNPATVVPREYLLPGSRDGPVQAHFPYSIAVLRIALMPRVHTRLTGRPSWGDFYQAGHPSGALPLTLAIAEAFAHEARQRGKRPLVVMLPGASSFRAREKFGAFEYAPLVEAMAVRKIDVFDPGEALRAALGTRSTCELYADPAGCNGHFGIAGSGVVADVVAADLRRRGWVK